MWVGGNKVDCVLRWLRRNRGLGLLLFLTCFASDALADGCFVFKWDKKIDINEPTQKAIVVFDSGHEEILLQVKYEGPLEEFGWLIPTPALPKVEKGSMEPFYELSQLTQRRFGRTRGIAGTKGMEASRGGHEDVEVIETKTVGAYEVTVLSAQDSGSLARWLAAHDYTFPEGKSEIVDEYIRRGWYFIAAKIQLNAGLGFKTFALSETKNPQSRTSARQAIQSKLSGGELHPLLITFDTPKPLFPLKISAIGGKPSEVSLYLIAKEPLLEQFIFGKAIENLEQQYRQWEQEKPQRQKQRETAMQSTGTIGIGMSLDSFYRTNRSDMRANYARDYSKEDLIRIGNEARTPPPSNNLGETFYPSGPEEMLQVMRLSSEKIPKSLKALPRLKEGNWYLTKLVHTFTPLEMHDLTFEPTVPALAEVLSRNIGGTAAQILVELGPDADKALRRAFRSKDSTERLNAAIGLERRQSKEFSDELAKLLKDGTPVVRLHALRVAELAPDARFADTIVGLLHDSSDEIRQEASGYLSNHENIKRTSFYLGLLNDPDPNVRAASIWIACWINKFKGSHDVFVRARRLLKDPNEGVREVALRVVYQLRDEEIPREEILPFLGSPKPVVSGMAIGILRRGAGMGRFEETGGLSSAEVARLMTNSATMPRLSGLKFLEYNADAQAVEIILPLLSDTNTIVRNRAFAVLRKISQEKIPDDPEKWKAWWSVNKASFATHPAPGERP
jgi:HEAT repeat protein